MVEPTRSRVAAALETLGCLASAVVGGGVLVLLLALWGVL